MPAAAQTADPPTSVAELKKLSVEELMGLEVTSVSRNEERLAAAAAAVTIVTGEDIRRSGATTVPEALRLVPGLHVARQTSSAWVVASRGFSSINSEKLLVLSDTRSIYTPLLSGVFWDQQDYLLQDIDRIEVIRGPGATLWGSNAVNGVINITTKSARDTQGLYTETSAGTQEHASVAARYGGRIGNRAFYRVFGKFFDRDATFGANPVSPDDWEAGHAGWRVDWHSTSSPPADPTPRDTVTVQGDIYSGDVGQLIPSVIVEGRQGPQGRLRVGVGGGNMLARWRRTTSRDADLQLRVYYDRSHRDDPMFVDDLDTVDVDLQHRLSPARDHELTWGATYRFTSHRNDSRIIFSVDPPSSRDHLVSGFLQDQITLPHSLRLTIGTKLEHNEFSGFEVQPSGRVAWQASPNHVLWGAVSRAVRVPTRFERDIAIDLTDPQGDPVARLLGNREFGAERLLAFEGGYRWLVLDGLATDLAAFYNRYTGLSSLEFGDPFLDPLRQRTIVPVENQNLTSGRARGIEALVTHAPIPTARFTASYAYLDLSLDSEGGDLNRGEFLSGSTPRHQLGVRSSVDLPGRFQVDGLFRYLSAIRRLPTSLTGEGIPAYAELDVRLAWLGWRRAELSLIGKNLLHEHHAEFGVAGARGEISRSIHAGFAWGF
jgi:iron complex outermembrane recepter protein